MNLLHADGFPPTVFAAITTRHYLQNKPNALNYDPSDPRRCFADLTVDFDLPSPPTWIKQVHGNAVISDCHVPNTRDNFPQADALVTGTPQKVLAILTADCLPIVLYCQHTKQLALIHAGWRGLAAAIIASTLARMPHQPEAVLAWLGPCICFDCFVIGQSVYDAFINSDPSLHPCFKPHCQQPQRYCASLQKIATQQLQQHGIERIICHSACTMGQVERFYSYRKEKITGRMVTIVYRRG